MHDIIHIDTVFTHTTVTEMIKELEWSSLLERLYSWYGLTIYHTEWSCCTPPPEVRYPQQHIHT